MTRYCSTGSFSIAVVVMAMGVAASALAGPISPYYLTAGDQGKNWVVQGGAVVNSWAQHHPESGGEYALAVQATVRTLGNGNPEQHHAGSEYALNGVYTGVDYPYPVGAPRFYDGSTDGTFNYSIDFGAGGVYRFSSEWTNPTYLFSTAKSYLGITYDPSNNSLWISAWTTGRIENRMLSGALLSSFNLPFSSISCLALDPADGTLWMGSQNTQGTFYQYSRSGVQLSTATYSSLTNQNTLGGEFPMAIPEPSTLALLALAGLGLVWPRRK